MLLSLFRIKSIYDVPIKYTSMDVYFVDTFKLDLILERDSSMRFLLGSFIKEQIHLRFINLPFLLPFFFYYIEFVRQKTGGQNKISCYCPLIKGSVA
jgi:hypothetical protein